MTEKPVAQRPSLKIKGLLTTSKGAIAQLEGVDEPVQAGSIVKMEKDGVMYRWRID